MESFGRKAAAAARARRAGRPTTAWAGAEGVNGETLLEAASQTAVGGRLALYAAGPWTAERAGELERLIDRVIAGHPKVDGIDIDMQRVERLDTFGAWLLERLLRGLGGGDTRIIGLAERYRALVLQARDLNRASAERAQMSSLTAALDLVGRTVVHIAHDIVAVIGMIGALTAAVGRAVAHPRTFRFTSMVHQIDRVGW